MGGSRERKGGFAKRANPLKEKKRERGSSKSERFVFSGSKIYDTGCKNQLFRGSHHLPGRGHFLPGFYTRQGYRGHFGPTRRR